MNNTIEDLTKILQDRKQADPSSSYVSSLYHKGLNSILKKVGEEAAETIIAAKDGNKADIIYETADLWFHTMVMLVEKGIEPKEILIELEKRFGQSGIEEKASRKK